MDIKIRDYIFSNFKNNNKDKLKESINQSIDEEDELTLPGLGVFFEILWQESNQKEQDEILKKLEDYFKKS